MLMTGREYLESIRDGRALYVGRERSPIRRGIRLSQAARALMRRSMT